MRGHRWSGKSRAIALVLMLSTAIAPMGSPRTVRAEEAVIQQGAPGEGGEADRWWGVFGAALCGAEIRLIRHAPTIGMNPYALAAGIAGCTLAVLDVMTTE